MTQAQYKIIRPLVRQLLLGFGAALSVIGFVTANVVYTNLKVQSEKKIQNKAQQIAQGIEFAAEGLIETQDTYLLDRLVQNYASWPSVVEVAIVGPTGIVLAYSNELDIIHRGDSLQLQTLVPELATSFETASISGQTITKTTKWQDRSVVVYVLPLRAYLFPSLNGDSPILGQRRGAVIAVMDRQQLLRQARATALMAIAVLVGAGSLTLMLMAALIQRLVLRPLTLLHRSLSRQDSLAPFTLPPLPHNEIGFLGNTLAQTFDQLKHYQDQALKLAEQKYVEIAQRYELASQATRVWIWEWQPGSEMVEIDSSLLYWLGFAPESTADGFVECRDFFIFEGDRPKFWQTLHQQGQKESIAEFTCECRLQNTAGQIFWCLLRGQRYSPKFAQKQRIIGTITDITERKQAEDKLQQSNQILAKATRLKDEFLANMSHELRTPLNAVLGMTEALQDEVYGEINPKQRHCLDTVEYSGRHLLSLINDILDLSKIEADKIELTLVPVQIEALCSMSLTFIKQFAQQKNIALRCQLPSSLPAIKGDERRLRQVLINLLNNAVKFTPEGGTVTLKVTLDTDPDTETLTPITGDRLRITVEDTGIGIAPEDITKLFQPFVQIDSALNRRYDGTGLGLALVKKIVELHGGTVGVTSQPQVGSCFFVSLPCAAAIAPTASPALLSPGAKNN